MKALPLCPPGLNRVLNSLLRVTKIEFHKIWCREGISQNIGGIKIKPKKVLIQFKDKLKMLDEGSNTENRLVIIFN